MKNQEFKFWSKSVFIFFLAWVALLFFGFDSPRALVSENWSYTVLGFFGAILGNLSAVGGGIVFIPATMFIYHLSPVQALKVALASQSIGMSSGAIGWYQRGTVPSSALKICIPPLLLGSFLSSLVFHPSALLVKLLFGPVSIGLGVLTLVTLKKSSPKDTLQPIPRAAHMPMALTAFLGGIITGWIAIGEGEMVTALLMMGYGVSAEMAISLGVVLLAVNSVYLMLIHQFFLGGIPWSTGIFTGLGCFYGARFAPFVSHRFSGKTLKLIFAMIAIADGSLFIFQYMFKK